MKLCNLIGKKKMPERETFKEIFILQTSTRFANHFQNEFKVQCNSHFPQFHLEKNSIFSYDLFSQKNNLYLFPLLFIHKYIFLCHLIFLVTTKKHSIEKFYYLIKKIFFQRNRIFLFDLYWKI